MMLSLPEDWNYSTRGLAAICREGVDAIRGALRELEKEGYVIRRQLRGPGGQIQDIEYLIYEQPPGTGSPGTGNPSAVRPRPEKSAGSNRVIQNQTIQDGGLQTSKSEKMRSRHGEQCLHHDAPCSFFYF